VADALTAAAAAGNYVWWFTSRAQRFPVCEFALLRDENGIDVPLAVYRSVQDYEWLSDKQADGDPTSILVETLRIATAVTLDCQPNDVTKVVNLTVLYPAEDYDASTDDVAFPQEWFRALVYQLGMDLSVRGGRPISADLKLMRDEALAMAKQVNAETIDLHFEPGRD
jgi:hypothetical protein